MIKSTLKIARYCPLVIQGFSNFLGVVSSDDKANPEIHGNALPSREFLANGHDLWKHHPVTHLAASA